MKKNKELLTEALVELMKTKREMLHEIVLEALEDVGLANAISEGRAGDYVPESQIISILEGKTQQFSFCDGEPHGRPE